MEIKEMSSKRKNQIIGFTLIALINIVAFAKKAFIVWAIAHFGFGF